MGDAPSEKAPRLSKRTDIPTVSRCLSDGTIVELLYDPGQGTTAFAVWREGTWNIETRVEHGTERLVPFSPNNNIIKNDVVLLPSAPVDYGTKAELLGEIRHFLHRYVDTDPAFEAIAAHYVLLTWLYDVFNEVPYLRFQGDFGTGKTRALLVIGSVCCRAFFASGASTVSPIFHILDAFRGTLVLDEADFRFSDEKAELVKIFNNGNVNGMPVLRTTVMRNREFNPRAFHVFGPKIIAMRGSYDDRALESRFLTEVMGQRPLRRGIPINLSGEMKTAALNLRNKLLLYRLEHRSGLRLDREAAVEGVMPRINQILTPLLSIVDDAAVRAELRRFATAAYEGIVAERSLSTEAQLLAIIRELAAEQRTGSVAISDLAPRFAQRFGEEYARPISPRWIGTVLRQRLHLTPHKSHGRYVLAVHDQSKLAALYERYGIGEPVNEATA
ncbi:MAG TPA: hypothetical protein VMF32_04255 [Xanthobacteraceae bacterium]|nr:hypothetical protein [Xanthobacteraceae bacterium]